MSDDALRIYEERRALQRDGFHAPLIRPLVERAERRTQFLIFIRQDRKRQTQLCMKLFV